MLYITEIKHEMIHKWFYIFKNTSTILKVILIHYNNVIHLK